MKINRKTIIHELPQAIFSLSQMQMAGGLSLTHKISYSLSKNLSKAISLQKEFNLFREAEIKKYCEFDEKNVPIFIDVPTPQGVQKEYKFSAENRVIFDKLIKDYLDEEVDVDVHKISLSELEKINNLPVTFISLIDEMGMISELKLA